MTVRPAENPFASRRIDAVTYHFQNSGVASVVERLHRSAGRGAIIGPHGSGKTTLVEELADRLDGLAVWVRLNAGTSSPMALATTDLPHSVTDEHSVFVDGAEQLGPWSWWRLLRRARNARNIVITSHTPGRLPTIHECATSPELLVELVRELAPEMTDSIDLVELIHRHNGNIRRCFRELYDVWARRGGR